MTSARFDMLLRIAMEELALEEMEFCDSIDPSPLLIGEQTQQKVCRMIRLNNIKSAFRTGFNVLKKMAVACMLVVTVAFSSAMCIEPVREAFVEAIVTWYEEYIAIYFEVEDNSDDGTNDRPIPTYLPEGWILEKIDETYSSVMYDIYGSEGEYICYQQVLDSDEEIWVNNSSNLEEIELDNGVVAYLTRDAENDVFNLVFCKDSCIFQFTAIGVPFEILIKIGESIK